MEAQIGANLSRIVADRGHRGYNAPPDHKFKVYISGQRRGVTDAIKRDLRRRWAVEPVIGHAKSDHPMDRNFLIGASAILAAAGYNFRRFLGCLLLAALEAGEGDTARVEDARRERVPHGPLAHPLHAAIGVITWTIHPIRRTHDPERDPPNRPHRPPARRRPLADGAARRDPRGRNLARQAEERASTLPRSLI
jgi:hypothetical protein